MSNYLMLKYPEAHPISHIPFSRDSSFGAADLRRKSGPSLVSLGRGVIRLLRGDVS